MPTRRVIKAVLHNFVGRLSSRYSDYHGYWLFGFIVPTLETIDINLLASPDDLPPGSALDALRRLALIRFREQLERARVDPSYLRAATLSIQGVPGDVTVRFGDHAGIGQNLRFTALALTDRGQSYRCEKTISVATHDPTFERSNARPDSLTTLSEPRARAVTLYRPVGQAELDLIRATGFTAFPPPLPHQPIFYPVLTEPYAIQIARDWNTKDPASGFAGYVTRFAVDAEYLSRFPVQKVGSAEALEYWIPAEELDNFNRHIVGTIQVVREFRATC